MLNTLPCLTTSIKRAAFAVTLAAAAATDAAAQDSHYWTYQYGTRANLLSGAVVGSVVDISAAYYNPGALSLVDDISIIATQKVFELSNIKFDPALGVDASLNELRLDLAPGFFAGILPFHFLGNDVLAYSLFTRYLFKSDVNAVALGDLAEVTDSLTGDFLSSVGFVRELNETWVGLSYSSPFQEVMGIGLTAYVSYRNQKGSTGFMFESLNDLDESFISIRDRGFSYWNAAILFKGGIAFDWLGASVGLTVTTPRINLFGDGKVLFNRSLFNSENVFVADYQEGLSSTYKTPWSVALGAAYKRESSTLHFTLEYFAPVGEFAILSPEPFVGQSTGDTITVQLTQELADVLNFGVGVEHTFRPHLSGYLSFRTDFSADIEGSDDTSDIGMAGWDIYFITAGAAFRLGDADLTAGLTFGWGSSQSRLPDDPALPSPSPTVNMQYRTLRLILAFAI
jgi:hypothetical protein